MTLNRFAFKTMLLAIIAGSVVSWSAISVWAENSVVVESKTLAPSSAGVIIGVKLTNDVELAAIVTPLVIRSITPGSFITALAGSRNPTDRLSNTSGVGALQGIAKIQRYNTEDGNCKNSQTGGFRTTVPVAYAGPWTSPAAVLMVCGQFDPNDPSDPLLAPGTDTSAAGSLQLTVAVTETPGSFEIDTTCTDPDNHLVFLDPNNVISTPAFTRGIILISNSPPVARDTSWSMNQDTLHNVGYLPASDPDAGQVLTYAILSGPHHASATGFNSATGAFAYAPVGGYIGPDSLVFSVCDDFAPSLCDTGKVRVAVLSINHPPVARCRNVRVDGDATCHASASIDSLSYDPDNGGTITLAQVPPGPYSLGQTSVKLVVTNNHGVIDSCRATVTVQDKTKPVINCPANIDRSNDPGICGAVVTYTPTAADNCSTPVVVVTPPSGSIFALGTTPVTVVAADPSGNADTCHFIVTIRDTQRPTITSCPGDIVRANGRDSCGTKVDFTVSATDNCGAPTVTATPPSGSEFPIGVTHVKTWASDASGNISDTCRFTVTINDTQRPTAICRPDTTLTLPHGQTDTVVSFSSWGIDNCPGATIVCTPASGSRFPPGTTTVNCVAIDLAGNRDSCAFEVIVQQSLLNADFSAEPLCGVSPLDVTFTDLSTSAGLPIISWLWNFGDGLTSTQQNPIHQYTSQGVYDVALTVSDGVGSLTVTKQNLVVVQDSLPADFIGYPLSGHVPLTTLFEPTPGGFANGYYWDFGDGTSSTLRNPIHTYMIPGQYSVKLRVRCDLGSCHQEDSITKVDYVVASTLKAQFTATPREGVAPLAVQFTDLSNGSPTDWFWDFGDGTTSTERNPRHTYGVAGTFDVFLRIADPLGMDSVLSLAYVHADPAPYVDLVGNLFAPWLRPGFPFWLNALWTNIGNVAGEACTLKVLLPQQAALYAVDPGTIRAGSYSRWWLDHDTIVVPLGGVDPTPWYGGYVRVYAILSPSVPLGTELTTRSWLSTSSTDIDPASNHCFLTMTVVGSIDPNDKRALPEGEGLEKKIRPSDRLTYRIDFENKKEATAEAIYVLVFDTLDTDLDWATFAEESSSHPDKCKLTFDPYTGVIAYFCDSIMLPPNVNSPEGEGYFTFSILPKRDLPNGTQISNRAHIRFDYNAFLAAPADGPVIRTVRSCDCPHQGNINGDSFIDVLDVLKVIQIAFVNGANTQDPGCPKTRGDVNNNSVVDVNDVLYIIRTAFLNGPPPVNPCGP